MRIQDAVLDALEKNRGEYLSGEQLASSLGVSRNAVWKAIQKLEEAGHKIRAVPKRGYTLAPESDVLTVQSVTRFLDTDMPVYLQVQTEVTSTNTLLKAQAEQGAPEGTSPDGRIVETVEVPQNDFCIGVQFHPEFKSRPNKAHPLFLGFVGASLNKREKNA